MKRVLYAIVFVVCLISGTDAGAESVPAGTGVDFAGFHFPPSLGPFKLAEVDPMEKSKPGLGYVMHYHERGRAKASVYYYDFGEKDIPEGADNERVKQHFYQLRQAVMTSYQRRGVNGHHVQSYGMGTERVETLYLCAEFAAEGENGKPGERSWLYLTAFGGHYFKIRLTQIDDVPPDQRAHQFAVYMFDALMQTQASKAQP